MATGSVAEISDPNIKDSKALLVFKGIQPAKALKYNPYPTITVDNDVPTTAYTKIEPIFEKKLFLSSVYPASNTIGGNKMKKKNKGSNLQYSTHVNIQIL